MGRAKAAEYLHLVDLDGARAGKVANWASIEAIVAAVKIPCELGGGIRDEATIARLLELGLARVVIGTLALKQPDWFRQMCRKFPGQLALGIDARGGLVATDGWLETSDVPAVDLAQQLRRASRWRRSSIPTSPPTACWPGRTWRRWPRWQQAVDAAGDRLGRRDHGRRRRPAGRSAHGRLHHRPGTVRGNLDAWPTRWRAAR